MSPSDGKPNALVHHCTFKGRSVRGRVLNLCPFSVGGPLHLWDIKARQLCHVLYVLGWKYCIQAGHLKEPHKRNVTLVTYPVRVDYKDRCLLDLNHCHQTISNVQLISERMMEVPLRLVTLWSTVL